MLSEAASIQVRAALNGPVAVATVGPVTGDGARDAGYAESDYRSGALVHAVMSWWTTCG